MKDRDSALEEETLRARFAALRAADQVAAPSFDAVLDASHRGSGSRLWPAAAMVGALAVLVAVGLRVRAPAPPSPTLPAPTEVMLSVAAEMPSDFLLEPPSDDVRKDLPRLTRADNEEVPFL